MGSIKEEAEAPRSLESLSSLKTGIAQKAFSIHQEGRGLGDLKKPLNS